MSTRALDDARLAPPDDEYEDPTDGEPCTICGGTGEVWFDVELADGRVREDMRPCGCGSEA